MRGPESSQAVVVPLRRPKEGNEVPLILSIEMLTSLEVSRKRPGFELLYSTALILCQSGLLADSGSDLLYKTFVLVTGTE